MQPAVIIGASHAGAQAAASLRQAGWQDGIVLLSDEDDLPYHRPPLSKAFLSGEEDGLTPLRSEGFYAKQGIELALATPALGIDPAAMTVETRGGRIGFSRLVLATGLRARRLEVPGAELGGVLTLRDARDARAIRQALAAADSVVIVGGGFIGLELAATAVKAGCKVTLVETQPRLLARALPDAMSAFLLAGHRRAGVTIHLGRGVAALSGGGGTVSAVTLDDGTAISADLVVAGIGGIAVTGLAEAAGLALEAGGIRVDADLRSSHPAIHAVGDVAAAEGRYWPGRRRIESVQNATDQAKLVAAAMVGAARPPMPAPWFWTDQYGMRIQMAGLSEPGTRVVTRGDPAAGAFSLMELRGDRLVAVHSVNSPADHMAARKLIAAGARLDPAVAADTGQPLAAAQRDAMAAS